MVCKTHHTAPAKGVPPEARMSNLSGNGCPCRKIGNTELVTETAGKAVTAGFTPRIWLSAVATAKQARLARLIGAPAMLPLASSRIWTAVLIPCCSDSFWKTRALLTCRRYRELVWSIPCKAHCLSMCLQHTRSCIFRHTLDIVHANIMLKFFHKF